MTLDLASLIKNAQGKTKENVNNMKKKIYGNDFGIDKSKYMPDDIYSSFADWYKELYENDPDYAYKVAKDLDIDTRWGLPKDSYYQVAGDRLFKKYKKDYEKELGDAVNFINETSDKINSLKSEYDKTSDENKKYELSTMINALYKGLETSGARKVIANQMVLDNPKVFNNLDNLDKYINTVDVEKDKKALDDYNARIEQQKALEEKKRLEAEEKARQEAEQKANEPTVEPVENPTVEPTPTENPNIDEWGHDVNTPVDETPNDTDSEIEKLNSALREGLSQIQIEKDPMGNPVISGRVGYTYDDAKLGVDELNNVVNNRINEALTPFLQSNAFTTRQKIDALDGFFMNNPQYANADLYNVVKFKNNLFSDINTILTSNLSDDEKVMRMNDLATQYELFVGDNKDLFPFALSDMWNDFQIDKDLSQRGLLKLAMDTTVDGQELSKALDMYISNKSIYDDAIKNYESMVSSYTPQKLEGIGQEYGDIASKYNAQKLDQQVTNTAKGLGQSDAVATQLGNEAQYQNYAENLAENQMKQTDAATDYAQNKLNNEYAKVQNAYNNAMQAENAVMGEVDKNQADINAYLTKQGVDLATDKYNYDRKIAPVNIATTIGNGVANAVDKIKN